MTEYKPLRSRRKPRKALGRARWLLGKLAAFVEVWGWWPSAPQLAEAIGRGSRWTCWRDLCVLWHAGLVQMDRRTWAITNDGFEFLGIPPIMPRHARRPKPRSRKEKNAEAQARRNVVRRDAFALLDQHATRPPWQSGSAANDDGLPIVG